MEWTDTRTHTHTQKSNKHPTTKIPLVGHAPGRKKTVAKRFLTKKKEDFIPGDRLEPPSSGNYRSQLSQDLWAADSEDSA